MSAPNVNGVSTRVKRVGRSPRARRPAKRAAAIGLPGAGPDLAPAARRLLEGARRVLARSGYNGLTLEAIAQESGENKALVRYYFRSKAGLVVALVDSLVAETLWRSRQRLARGDLGRSPAEAVTDVSRELLSDPASYELFFDLFPRLLEDPRMAEQLADLYRGYRDHNVRALWAGHSGEAPQLVRDLAAMTVALTDGLAVQVLAEPGSVEVSRLLSLWNAFMEQTLAQLYEGESEQPASE